MKPENIAFLEKNRACYREVSNVVGGRSAGLAHRITGELLTILREEFEPGYPAPHDCGNCLFNLVTTLYEKFDEYMAKQPKPIVVAANFPKNDPPIDPEYAQFLEWKKSKNKSAIDNAVSTVDEMVNTYGIKETPEQKNARLADPNRVIKRRAKRK